MFEGENVAVEIREERKMVANVSGRDFAGDGKNPRRNSRRPQRGLHMAHWRNFRKNIPEAGAKLLQLHVHPGQLAYLAVKFIRGDLAGFVLIKERRMAEQE